MTVSGTAVKAIVNHEAWDTCDHVGSGPRDHRCPKCRGTLRRCCNTLVSMRPHEETCHAMQQRRAEMAAEKAEKAAKEAETPAKEAETPAT